MSEHKASIQWQRAGAAPDFIAGKYSREHHWTFDGGVTVPASPAPSVVPIPYSNPANVDPEESYVAAVSSCHMLTFLYVASRAKIIVDAYRDDAVGYMTKNERGIPWVSSITLNPQIAFNPETLPSAEIVAGLHHQAHEQCFIANSIKTEVHVAGINEALANDDYEISTDKHRLDVGMIHEFLRTSYWAADIPRRIVQKSIDHSLCFGVFHHGKQVGFARMITDYATMGYLADVFILPDYRGRGLAKKLMRSIMDHPQLKGLRRLVLATKDAHGLYAQVGFEPLAQPSDFMTIHHPNIYRNP